MPSSHLILCRPLLLLPSIFPSIRVFSNESVLRIRWPKYWSFSVSISPSNEYSGLISFMMDWLDLLAVQGTLNNLLQHHSSKASVLKYNHQKSQMSSFPAATTKWIPLPKSRPTKQWEEYWKCIVRPYLVFLGLDLRWGYRHEMGSSLMFRCQRAGLRESRTPVPLVQRGAWAASLGLCRLGNVMGHMCVSEHVHERIHTTVYTCVCKSCLSSPPPAAGTTGTQRPGGSQIASQEACGLSAAREPQTRRPSLQGRWLLAPRLMLLGKHSL